MSLWSNPKKLERLKHLNDPPVPKIKCRHSWYYDGGDYQCEICNLIGDIPCYEKDPNATYVFWPREYDRLNYFNKIFDIMTGKCPCHVIQNENEKEREDLVQHIGLISDWYEVYQVFKKFDLKEWWTAWNIISDNPRRIEELKPHHIQVLYYIDNIYSDLTHIRKKKKMNVFFMLYKIVERYGDDVSVVPLKLRSTCIERLDEEWKVVCQLLNWEFKPTRKSLQKINWNSPLYVPNNLPPIKN